MRPYKSSIIFVYFLYIQQVNPRFGLLGIKSTKSVMDFDESYFLNKKLKHLTKWVSRFKEAKDVLPEVQKNLDMTNWEKEALTNLPTTSPQGIKQTFERDCNTAIQAYPMIPIYAPITSTTATSMATAGTNAVYDHIVSCENSAIPEVANYSREYTKRYRKLQEDQQRPKRVRDLMVKHVNFSTLERFDEAENAYWKAKSDTDNRKEAALKMRNLLSGLKDDLFQLARSKNQENMTWEEMIKWLGIGVDNG